MNFCPKCHFMLYTKIIDEGSSKLQNYCKNCDWKGDYQSSEDNIVVYQRNYSNEFLTEKSKLSEHVINDPTLPRINNIACINIECLTNKNYPEEQCFSIKSDNLNNITDHTINSKINQIVDKEISDLEIIRVNNNINILKFNETDCNLFNSFLENNSNFYINDKLIEVNKYSKPNREIIFIKYDPINLKYLYICSTCKSTWKNE